MKLTTFIERRLNIPVPMSMIHKWIRSGQVRVNKKRAKPFQRLTTGDLVRIPPFADLRAQTAPSPALSTADLFTLPVVHTSNGVLVINKPAGLAVQPGSGLADSVVHRLRLAYAQSAFIPAPAHRLDKNTSGLLAIGLDHASLAGLSQWFATPDNTHKHYLAWVYGGWEPAKAVLEDYLCKSQTGRQNMQCVDKDWPGALFARSHIIKLAQTTFEGFPATLLRVALETGRTHQIRAQLSQRGFPIIGDVRYGGPPHSPMLLHAYELDLPSIGPIRCFPAWPAPFEVTVALVYGQRI